MPATQISRAKQLMEQEKHMTTAQQIEMWVGRRGAALAWAEECSLAIMRLLDAGSAASSLEVDVIVEPATPPPPGPLPGLT